MQKHGKKQFVELSKILDLFKLLKTLKDIKGNAKRKRSCAVRQINKTRNRFGYFKVTFCAILNDDQQQFFVHTRMTREAFNMLLELIKHEMTQSTRCLINAEFRLALTLLYLSQGCSFQSLAWSWKVGKETVRLIVYETCDALWNVLGKLYVTEPTLHDTSKISSDFWEMWNLPNCVGAVDGKHIAIQCPPQSASQFFNYKKFFSIVLMAACDATYIFTHVDVGAYGSESDGGIFNRSSFGKRLARGELIIPEPKPLPGTSNVIAHYFVGDAAFALTPNLMKPYPGLGLSKAREIYNKRLSRARRVIENAFGILVSRWRILLTTLNMQPSNAEKIVLACVALHNYLRLNKEATKFYSPTQFTDWEDSSHNVQPGLWRRDVNRNLPSMQASRNLHVLGGRKALNMRDTLCSYVNNEGRLDWLQ